MHTQQAVMTQVTTIIQVMWTDPLSSTSSFVRGHMSQRNEWRL
jgi:hypothetical protein